MLSKRSLTLAGLLTGAVVISAVLLCAPLGTAAGNSYVQTNLLSDTMAIHGHKPDLKLMNPWGNAFFPSGPFWINDQVTGVSELIDGQGNITPGLPFVTIPAGSTPRLRTGPTGIVTNSSTNEFLLGKTGSAVFIFDTIDGTISAWNTGNMPFNKAVIKVDNSAKHATYTGLAMANMGAKHFLYVANALGSVDVFDDNFKPFPIPGGFVDKNTMGLPPYGIANIEGNIFVAYGSFMSTTGVVDEFTSGGHLIRRFATGGTLNQPWAIVLAPKNFGAFGTNDLLIGNFGDGTINAFNFTTGKFLDRLRDPKGHPISILGLWSLVDGGDAAMGVPNSLYFTAGPNGQKDGLFGYIVAGGGPTPTATKKRSTPTPTKKRATPTPTKKRPTPTPTKKRPTPTPTKKQPTPTPTMGYPY